MTNIKQYPLIKSILARKFIFYILLFSSIITLIGTSIQLYLEYNKDKTQIQNTLDQIETAHLQSIVNNLWLSDQELINVQLQEMLSLPEIKHISIYSDGEEKISVGSRKSTMIISREYPLTYAFRNQEVRLGSLRIEGSLDNALQRLRSRVFVILLTQGIKTFLVSLFIFFVFYFLIGRHLRTIADFARRIDLQTIDTSTRLELLPERGQPDELDQVASSLNDMQGRLRANTIKRKQAEEAQQTSEENYRLLFTELNSGFGLNEVICDEAGLPCNYRFLAVNHAFEKMMGMPAEQIVGKTILEIMPAMPRSRIERYGSIALTGISEEFEEYSPLIGKHLEISVYSPKRGQFAVIFHDITKRKQAEVALRDNEEKYRHLYETMTQGVILQDSEGKVIEANVSACEILGLSMDQLFEKTAYDPRWKLVHEDGSPYDPSEMPSNIALLTGKPVENVFCGIYVPEKGEHRWIMIGSSPKFREGETQPYMTMTVFSNITKRKQAEDELLRHRYHLEELVEERTEELRASEERYRSMFHNNLSIMLIIDPATADIIDANPAALSFYGYNHDQITGMKISDINVMSEAEICAEKGRAKKALRKHFYFRHRLACGSIVDVEVFSGAVYIHDRELLYSIIHDITSRRQAEEALQKVHDELEQRVEDRTVELQKTHEQLLHVEKLSAIGSLSASFAHEFNNPLTGVTNVIRGIKKRAVFDEDDSELIDMAILECKRMKDLILSLQNFNRPTSGNVAIVDIHEIIDSLLLLSKKHFHLNQISVEKNYADNLPHIQAVADQIKQVILNLLNNSVDACEQGGTITINTEKENDNIIIRVNDSGIGIKPEDINHIFDPFFTTKPEVKGTGLGLSISYGIVKKHGGTIDVKSGPGKGSVFAVTLPISGVVDA